MAEPRLRPASQEEDAAIRKLLAAAYPDNPKADAALTRWQYWENPFGPTRAWVWEQDGEVIAHWAAVALPLLLDGRPVMGAKGVDIATHPAHRRRGLFARLARALVADLADAGVPALLSHPNPQSFPGVTAAGLVEAVRARVLAAPVNPEWLARRFRLPGAAARFALRLAGPLRVPGAVTVSDSVPSDLTDLWQRVASAHPWGVRRDAGWFDWRYRAHPIQRYRHVTVRHDDALSGLAVARPRTAFGGTFLSVLEFLAQNDSAAQSLVAGLMGEARAKGLDGVVMAVAPGSVAERQGRAGGLWRVPRRLEPFPLRACVAAPDGPSASLAGQPWDFAWGDLDHL